MGARGLVYLLDTNILIYYTNGSIPAEFRPEMDRILTESFRVSIITKLEYLGWRGFDSTSFKKAAEFVGNAEIINIDQDITDRTIALRREQGIKLADALIAATAVSRQLTLITRNENDFTEVRGISVLNPFAGD